MYLAVLNNIILYVQNIHANECTYTQTHTYTHTHTHTTVCDTHTHMCACTRTHTHMHTHTHTHTHIHTHTHTNVIYILWCLNLFQKIWILHCTILKLIKIRNKQQNKQNKTFFSLSIQIFIVKPCIFYQIFMVKPCIFYIWLELIKAVFLHIGNWNTPQTTSSELDIFGKIMLINNILTYP